MSDKENPSIGMASRRDFLNIASVGGGALIAVGLTGSAMAGPKKKFTQQQAHYQPVPRSGDRCQNCVQWQPPASCQVVDGQVSPAGWCILYKAKG